ncbi:hypothetical protein MTR62_02490 [Novosphingobium sp. 1949]|uniref:Uncharacterized protein n=1 Tax=Novosphingobium organovorum TaxID=2930092 RepID=A0ABT0B941_9SPHN|nr:hypothetical protein [Novosphingobium organovorum]MCJ2181582.1 hypothetical protein [Novosphingobium organovorum]
MAGATRFTVCIVAGLVLGVAFGNLAMGLLAGVVAAVGFANVSLKNLRSDEDAG